MTVSKLQATIEAFRDFAQGKGWPILEERKIQNGFQLLVTDGITRVPIDCYTNGNASIRGSAGPLKANLQDWWQERKTSPAPPSSSGLEKDFVAHIGLDESGKGDYFGPLVIGAVYVDERTEQQLISLGVRDSKLLADNRILALAEAIKALCPHFVVPIEPKRYNELYNRIQNLNLLLAWGHAWTLEQMLEKVPGNLAIIDQFGDKSYILQALREKGRSITIEQHPRAEEDVAVAAASILARARFVQQLEQLSKRVGQALPKGASDPAIVTVGREIVAKFGKDILTEIAKLHFKTTQLILQTS